MMIATVARRRGRFGWTGREMRLLALCARRTDEPPGDGKQDRGEDRLERISDEEWVEATGQGRLQRVRHVKVAERDEQPRQTDRVNGQGAADKREQGTQPLAVPFALS